MANNSPQAMRSSSFHDMANNKPLGEQTAQLNANEKPKKNAGLPDDLKTGMDNLSGISLDAAKVHRNSDKPSQLQAHAYAQGTDIHLGPGQERHLPHELAHVVQQKQGRVKPTIQTKTGVNVNDDPKLEKEADQLADDLEKNIHSGVRKIVLWADKHSAKTVLFPSSEYDPFFNINTQGDLEEAQRRIKLS